MSEVQFNDDVCECLLGLNRVRVTVSGPIWTSVLAA